MDPLGLEQQLDFLQNAEMPQEVCEYLAMQTRRTRRASKLSQAELARCAGVPLRTYKRFETHGLGSLETFVRTLRALGRTRYLFMLFPQQVSPSKKSIVPRPRRSTSA
jgi:hypothetical protein